MTTPQSTLDLNTNTIFLDRVVRVYLKRSRRYKDPDKEDARYMRVKEELDSEKCYSMIKISCIHCSDIAA